jgi:hypothetical protein
MPKPKVVTKDTPIWYLCSLAAALLFAVAVSLYFQGRLWWCPAGDLSLWSWQVWSQHNSQHLVDPYSFTHLLHGIVEFWIVSLIFPRMKIGWRLIIALSVESSWEVAENTNYVINRYREATISLNYFGDSILNSLADVAFCGLGFGVAYWLRFWRSAALFVSTEVILLMLIHDSLLLNVLMLLYPMESVREWQNSRAY